MPPNKHDLGAKIQILNPNAPNYLFFRFQKILRFSNWQILGHFQSVKGKLWNSEFLNYFFNSNEIFARILNQIILTFWKYPIGKFLDILDQKILTFWKNQIGKFFDILKIPIWTWNNSTSFDCWKVIAKTWFLMANKVKEHLDSR